LSGSSASAPGVSKRQTQPSVDDSARHNHLGWLCTWDFATSPAAILRSSSSSSSPRVARAEDHRSPRLLAQLRRTVSDRRQRRAARRGSARPRTPRSSTPGAGAALGVRRRARAQAGGVATSWASASESTRASCLSAPIGPSSGPCHHAVARRRRAARARASPRGRRGRARAPQPTPPTRGRLQGALKARAHGDPARSRTDARITSTREAPSEADSLIDAAVIDRSVIDDSASVEAPAANGQAVACLQVKLPSVHRTRKNPVLD
jgi:hypothetical protein